MTRSRMLLFSLIMAMVVVFVAGESQAAVCFSFQRCLTGEGPTACPVGNLATQTLVMEFSPAAVIGPAFFKFVGRHDGACDQHSGAGGGITSRVMEGTGWLRSSSKIEMVFRTLGNTTSTIGAPNPSCGEIVTRVVIDPATLAGIAKFQEIVPDPAAMGMVGGAPITVVDSDTLTNFVTGASGVPVIATSCPSVPAN